MQLYHFGDGKADGDSSMIELLGGKGAHLASMSLMGIPVPPGFTVPTTACVEFMGSPDKDQFLTTTMDDVEFAYHQMQGVMGEWVLVSVRSGAAVSMPGMMDTVLNVGMCDEALPFWADKIGERAALDCYRRLIQMLGCTAFGIKSEVFEGLLTQARFRAKVTVDSEIPAEGLKALVSNYHLAFYEHAGIEFPQNVCEQLRAAVAAVFESWNNQRAIDYRNLNGIDHNMGTAVTVQAMVFGNMNDQSGSGVVFTRNASNGDPKPWGEFLPNAQGEDVVAGVRTPLTLGKMADQWPAVAEQLGMVCERLEAHYRDMMDIEFTVQDGKLYLLQCRVGKRSALAALNIATDFYRSDFITRDELRQRLTRKLVRQALLPQIAPSFKVEPNFQGLGANVGIATGIAVGSAAEAVAAAFPCILVTAETDPDDFAGMVAAQGVLTCTGGSTSHAAVVARAMQKPCVVGCTQLHEAMGDVIGKKVTIDGATGRVWVDQDVPVVGGEVPGAIYRLAGYIVDGAINHLQEPGSMIIPVSGGEWSKRVWTGWDGEAGYVKSWQPGSEPRQPNDFGGSDYRIFDAGGHKSKADPQVEALFACAPETPQAPAFISKPHKDTTVLATGPIAATIKGMKLIGEAQTLEAMLDQKTLNGSEAVAKKVGPAAYAKLLTVLTGAGFTATAIKTQPPIYTVMRALEEG